MKAGAWCWLARACTVAVLAAVMGCAMTSAGAAERATASTATATATATTSATPRTSRHALIIGLGRYQQDPARPVGALDGVTHDLRSARQMARALQVPDVNITELRDEQASRAGVQAALNALAQRVAPGDRVFVYWTGHGSRFHDPQAGGCVETLIPWDLKDFTHAEFARMLRPLGDKADKLMVVYDACHSGGAAAARPASRALGAAMLQAKTSGVSEACAQPSNVRTRSMESALSAAGMGLGDVVHISSSRPDELSFDNPQSGGLATTALRRCLMGEARDLDGSGAISADELVRCAQAQVEQAMRGATDITPQHLVVTGNRGFVPALFAAAPPVAPVPATVVAPVAAPTPVPVPAPVTAPTPVRATPGDILAQVHAQRDHKRSLKVTASAQRLRIDRDPLDLMLVSDRPGHVYVAMAGTDGASMTLLFPNELDSDNRIAAGQQLWLPRPSWRVVAGGPPGLDRLLVMVTDGPRDWRALRGQRAGPFLAPLLDQRGRSQLQALLGQQAGPCVQGACSDAFASALLDVEEVR